MRPGARCVASSGTKNARSKSGAAAPARAADVGAGGRPDYLPLDQLTESPALDARTGGTPSTAELSRWNSPSTSPSTSRAGPCSRRSPADRGEGEWLSRWQLPRCCRCSPKRRSSSVTGASRRWSMSWQTRWGPGWGLWSRCAAGAEADRVRVEPQTSALFLAEAAASDGHAAGGTAICALNGLQRPFRTAE